VKIARRSRRLTCRRCSGELMALCDHCRGAQDGCTVKKKPKPDDADERPATTSAVSNSSRPKPSVRKQATQNARTRKPQRSSSRPPIVDAAGHENQSLPERSQRPSAWRHDAWTNGGRKVLWPYSASPINRPPSVLTPMARRPNSSSAPAALRAALLPHEDGQQDGGDCVQDHLLRLIALDCRASSRNGYRRRQGDRTEVMML